MTWFGGARTLGIGVHLQCNYFWFRHIKICWAISSFSEVHRNCRKNSWSSLWGHLPNWQQTYIELKSFCYQMNFNPQWHNLVAGSSYFKSGQLSNILVESELLNNSWLQWFIFFPAVFATSFAGYHHIDCDLEEQFWASDLAWVYLRFICHWWNWTFFFYDLKNVDTWYPAWTSRLSLSFWRQKCPSESLLMIEPLLVVIRAQCWLPTIVLTEFGFHWLMAPGITEILSASSTLFADIFAL